MSPAWLNHQEHRHDFIHVPALDVKFRRGFLKTMLPGEQISRGYGRHQETAMATRCPSCCEHCHESNSSNGVFAKSSDTTSSPAASRAWSLVPWKVWNLPLLVRLAAPAVLVVHLSMWNYAASGCGARHLSPNDAHYLCTRFWTLVADYCTIALSPGLDDRPTSSSQTKVINLRPTDKISQSLSRLPAPEPP